MLGNRNKKCLTRTEKRESKDVKTESCWASVCSTFASDHRKENPLSQEQVSLGLSKGLGRLSDLGQGQGRSGHRATVLRWFLRYSQRWEEFWTERCAA